VDSPEYSSRSSPPPVPSSSKSSFPFPHERVYKQNTDRATAAVARFMGLQLLGPVWSGNASVGLLLPHGPWRCFDQVRDIMFSRNV